MFIGMSFGRPGAPHVETREPDGIRTIEVKHAYLSVLTNETRYLILRLIKTAISVVCYTTALALVCFAAIGGIMSLFSLDGAAEGMSPLIGPLGLIVWPMAMVLAFALIGIAVEVAEKYTRQADVPGVVEIVCPNCGQETPLFNTCAECCIEFLFYSEYKTGLLVGIVRLLNLLLTGFWWIICATGVLFLMLGML